MIINYVGAGNALQWWTITMLENFLCACKLLVSPINKDGIVITLCTPPKYSFSS